jgi:hypothetical protein
MHKDLTMPDDLEPDPPRDRCTLPTRLLHALLAGTTPDHPLVGIAVDRVLRTESLASYTAETALATELLGRVYAAGHAPLALLHAALAADDNSLVRLALTSPDLPEVDRSGWLTAAEPKRLAAVAVHLEGAPIAGLVAAEVARRTLAGRRMIDVFDGEPGVAEQLLLAGPVAVEVLDTAMDLLPQPPSGEELRIAFNTRFRRWRAEDDDAGERGRGDKDPDRTFLARDAFDDLLARILRVQQPHHAHLSDSARPHGERVAQMLLADLPWLLDDELLDELATRQLNELERTIAAACDDQSEGGADVAWQAVMKFPFEFRHLVNEELPEALRIPDVGAHRGRGAQAGPGWRGWASDAGHRHQLVARLAQLVAPTLPWLAASDMMIIEERELAGVYCTLALHPAPPDEVRVAAEHLAEAARARERNLRWRSDDRSGSYLQALAPLLGAPRPRQYEASAAAGRLVDDLSRPSARPTLKALRQLNIDQLRTVVDRRAGDDELVELALLAGSGTNQADPDQLLEAHSNPRGALLILTRELRRRLGGNPEDRCRWIRFVLRSRWCTEEVVAALPAHAAMAVVTEYRAPARQEQPNPIVTMIRARLGDHAGAWQRFAANPATKTGEGAWLRLGELLDAAVTGGPWPPPPRR